MPQNFQGAGLIDGFLALRDYINERKFLNSPEFRAYMAELGQQGTLNPDLARRAGKYPGVAQAVQFGFQAPREKSAVALTDEQTAGLRTDRTQREQTSKVLGMPLQAFEARTGRKQANVQGRRTALDENTSKALVAAGLLPSPEGANAAANMMNAKTAQQALDITKGHYADQAASTVLQNAPYLNPQVNPMSNAIMEALSKSSGTVGGIFDALSQSRAKEEADKAATLQSILGTGTTPPPVTAPPVQNPFENKGVIDAYQQATGTKRPALFDPTYIDESLLGVQTEPENVQDLANALNQIHQQVVKGLKVGPATTRDAARASAKNQSQLVSNIKALMSLITALQQTGTAIPPEIQQTMQELTKRGFVK